MEAHWSPPHTVTPFTFYFSQYRDTLVQMLMAAFGRKPGEEISVRALEGARACWCGCLGGGGNLWLGAGRVFVWVAGCL